jgi:hypothetical protein
VDVVEGLVEVVGQGVRGGDGVLASLDLDSAVTAGGGDELPDGPAGLVLDPAADGEGGEDDGQASPATACSALATKSSIPRRVRRARS